jgi:hypothetical protein
MGHGLLNTMCLSLGPAAVQRSDEGSAHGAMPAYLAHRTACLFQVALSAAPVSTDVNEACVVYFLRHGAILSRIAKEIAVGAGWKAALLI